MWGCDTQAIMKNPSINTAFSETICQYRSDAAILARSEPSEYFCRWSHTLMEHLLEQTRQVDVAAAHVETLKEFDVIYVNGDNNLENLRRPDENWKVRLIEDEFKRLMFDVQDV
jgi:hypothetical protein